MTNSTDEQAAFREWLEYQKKSTEYEVGEVERSIERETKQLDLMDRTGSSLPGWVSEGVSMDERRQELTQLIEMRESSLHALLEYYKSILRYDQLAPATLDTIQFEYKGIAAHAETFATKEERVNYLLWVRMQLDVEGAEATPAMQLHLANFLPIDEYSEELERRTEEIRKEIDSLIEYYRQILPVTATKQGATPERLQVTGTLTEFATIVEAMIESGILDRHTTNTAIASHFAYLKENKQIEALKDGNLRAARAEARDRLRNCTGPNLMSFVRFLLEYAYSGNEKRIAELDSIVGKLNK